MTDSKSQTNVLSDDFVSKTFDPQHLILWCDLETTGSTKACCDTIEYAFILTTATHEFTELWNDSGLVFTNIHVTGWPDAVKEMHSSSGLINDLMDDTIFKFHNTQQADMVVWSNISRLLTNMGFSKDVKITLAGSGVSHFDSMILQSQWPYVWSLLTGFADSDFLKPTLDLGVVRRFLKILNWPLPGDITPSRPHRALDDTISFLNQSRKLMEWLQEYYPSLDQIREAEEYLRAKGE